jgi:ketosteroid isomerase-like protein
MEPSAVELIRGGFAAAARGDLETIAAILSPDVRWHGAGDEGGGCQNREQALGWMREAIDRGIRVELLEVRELADGRVLVALQRRVQGDQAQAGARPSPHGQILTLQDGKVAEMVVYPTADEASAAAGER